MLDYLDTVGIIGWIVFHFWQLSSGPSGGNDRGWYTKSKVRVNCAPPGYVFGLVWFLLYSLLSVSAIVFFRNTVNYDAVFILWVVNIMLNKLWSVLFFDTGRVKAALAIAVGMLGTQIAIIVLIAVDGLAEVERWFPFASFIVYSLWLFVAIYLNAQWVAKKLPVKR